ncbi:pentatricopeptide repeat-containing protein At1g09410-like [Arachis ipaensis]|uniref:pentatricopeptide repeat-containing protein At1g09410-like n=1 Tax=Arachis ipaensis TaxID=130454 RepID=UPI0007AFCA3D|nr:pentatricopeptide repeat-containing protein At1g09410-like [Arachis ipaensis]XP_025678910.1 pentatricopeptide repeat-containing protein At1g09410, mitochondrial-like [Arachis hypogaea]
METFQMPKNNLQPCVPTGVSEKRFTVQACIPTKSVSLGKQLHSLIITSGCSSDKFVSNHLLNLCSKFGELRAAVLLFDRMPSRNIMLCKIMIKAHLEMGSFESAKKLFDEMPEKNDEYSLDNVLRGCAHLTALFAGQQIHAYVIKMDIRCSIINITPENIAVALGLTASGPLQFLVKRIQAEIKQDMEIAKRAQVRKQLKQRKKVEKKEKRSVIFAESEMQSKKRKQFIEDSSSKKETKSSKKETGSENEMQEKFTNLSETGLHSTEAHYDPSEMLKEQDELLNEAAPVLEAIIGSNPQEKMIVL